MNLTIVSKSLLKPVIIVEVYEISSGLSIRDIDIEMITLVIIGNVFIIFNRIETGKLPGHSLDSTYHAINYLLYRLFGNTVCNIVNQIKSGKSLDTIEEPESIKGQEGKYTYMFLLSLNNQTIKDYIQNQTGMELNNQDRAEETKILIDKICLLPMFYKGIPKSVIDKICQRRSSSSP